MVIFEDAEEESSKDCTCEVGKGVEGIGRVRDWSLVRVARLVYGNGAIRFFFCSDIESGFSFAVISYRFIFFIMYGQCCLWLLGEKIRNQIVIRGQCKIWMMKFM